MKKLFCALALMTMFASSIAFAQSGGDEQELVRLDKEWSEALRRGDRDMLARIMADDFTSRSGTENRTQYIERAIKDAKEAAADADLKNYVVTPFNYTVKFKGDGMAVMTHGNTERGQYKNQDFADYRNSLHVWVKRGGRWQVVASEGAPFNPEQTLTQIEREWSEALMRNDTAVLDKILADGYMFTGNDGMMETKAQSLASMKAGDLKIESMTETEPLKIRVYGDTAVVMGRGTVKGQYKGKAFTADERFTDTFVKRDGRWQAVSTHTSRVTPISAKN